MSEYIRTYVRTTAKHPPFSLAARECERPMSTSMCFQQSHMVLTLCRDRPQLTPLNTVLLVENVHRHNLYKRMRSPQRCGCVFHLAATAPYLNSDVMFTVQTLQCRCWLSLQHPHGPKSIQAPACGNSALFLL